MSDQHPWIGKVGALIEEGCANSPLVQADLYAARGCPWFIVSKSCALSPDR